jgi:hypothetical protein
MALFAASFQKDLLSLVHPPNFVRGVFYHRKFFFLSKHQFSSLLCTYFALQWLPHFFPLRTKVSQLCS